MQKRRANDIDVWRILFTYMILIFHFDNAFGLFGHFFENFMVGWYIATDFFFVVSGFLLYKKSDNSVSAIQYTWNKIRSIYPAYIIAFLLTWIAIIYCRNEKLTIGNLCLYISDFFPEMILMQGVGLGRGWNYVNPVAWYIPIYLMAGCLIYYALVSNKKRFNNLIAPIIICICFGYLYRNYGNMDVTIAHSGATILENPPLMRGLLGMCLGVYSAQLNEILLKKIADKSISKTGHLLVKTGGIICLLLVISMSLKWGYSHADFMYLGLIFAGVTSAFLPWKAEVSEQGKTKSRLNAVIIYLSGITLYLYLYHQMFRDYLFPHFFAKTWAYSLPEKLGILVLYLVIITAFSCLIKQIISLFRSKTRKSA